MPQMYPIYWMFMFLMVMMILLIIMMKLYFFLIYNNKMINLLKLKKFSIKW
uniref:ATP synthase complex subunit 8 n=1 Tax=Eoxenos laboulbenei TaxID=232561 RepID=B7ZE80_9NEOP|nr:ATPase subunit 8 [Eoxenos laboulbenei]